MERGREIGEEIREEQKEREREGECDKWEGRRKLLYVYM